MRTVINGTGVDMTQYLQRWLNNNQALEIANMFLIGNPDDADAQWLTDYATPLYYSYFGKRFEKANITRSSVKSSIGTKMDPLTVEWKPQNMTFVQDITRTSPYQQTYLGKFAGRNFYLWLAFMPTSGDCDSFGLAPWFGGRIGNSTTQRGSIKFIVNSFLDVVNQDMPGSVIETLNTIAGFKGATPPTGFTQVPTFQVVAGSSPSVIVADCLTPSSGHIFSSNAFQGGFLQFSTGQLQTMWSAIQTNANVSGPHNQFVLYKPFPWAPTIGDIFYASATFPINQADGQYFGFPYVPDPNSAL